jgi:hypothetical protein
MITLRSFLAASVSAAVMASSPGALAQVVLIATGSVVTTDGYLEIQTDAYGAWVQPFAGGQGPNDDRYKPAALPIRQVSFSSGFMLFGGSADRELLSDSVDWQAVQDVAMVQFGADASLSRAITSPTVASDTNADGINDTATSGFRVFNGAGVDLAFTLTQKVSVVSGAVSLAHLHYTVTNNGTSPYAFSMVRCADADLIWVGTATNDEVGTSCNGAGMGQYVFQREVGNNVTAITLSGGERGGAYFGGRDQDTPPLGPPMINFGTDSEIWDAFGMPTSWRNYITTAGYNTNGVNGAIPASQDAYIALDFRFNLAAGRTTGFDVYFTYGASAPPAIAAPCYGDTNGDGLVDLTDLANLLGAFGTTSGATLDLGDIDGNGAVDLADLATLLGRFGSSC